MSKKQSTVKLTTDLKSEIRDVFVRGIDDQDGLVRHHTLEELRIKYNVAKSTLYRVAKKENWIQEREDFQTKLRSETDVRRRTELVNESSQFDLNSLTLAKALMATVGQNIRKNTDNINNGSRGLLPAQLNALANAALSAQRLGKLALGETTDNVNINADTENEAFRRAMELLDSVAEGRREGDDKPIH